MATNVSRTGRIVPAFMLSAVAVAVIHAVPHRLAGMAAAANTALRQYGAESHGKAGQ